MTEERRQHIERASRHETEVRTIGRRIIAEHQEAFRLFEAYDRGEIKLFGRPKPHCT